MLNTPSRNKCCLTSICFVLFFSLESGWTQPPADNSSIRIPSTIPGFIKPKIDPATHILAVGDVIEFTLNTFMDGRPLEDARPSTYTVRADGNLELPVIGQVPVAGLRLSKVAENISVSLKKKLRNPKFRIGIVSVAPVQVLVLGEVARPGRYDIAPGSDIQEAIAVAGGFSAMADPTHIMVQDGLSNQTYKVSKPSQPGQPMLALKNSDIVYVQAGKRINVLGEVFKPGQFALSKESGSIQDALLSAGGVKPTAALKRSVIFRPGTGQSFPAIASEKQSTEQLEKLQEGDVLIVPPRQCVIIAQSPKAIALLGGETIMDIITQSGVPPEAKLDDVRVVRSGGSDVEHVNLKKFLETQDRSVLVPISDGDIVVVDIEQKSAFRFDFLQTIAGAFMNPLTLINLLR